MNKGTKSRILGRFWDYPEIHLKVKAILKDSECAKVSEIFSLISNHFVACCAPHLGLASNEPSDRQS